MLAWILGRTPHTTSYQPTHTQTNNGQLCNVLSLSVNRIFDIGRLDPSLEIGNVKKNIFNRRNKSRVSPPLAGSGAAVFQWAVSLAAYFYVHGTNLNPSGVKISFSN